MRSGSWVSAVVHFSSIEWRRQSDKSPFTFGHDEGVRFVLELLNSQWVLCVFILFLLPLN